MGAGFAREVGGSGTCYSAHTKPSTTHRDAVGSCSQNRYPQHRWGSHRGQHPHTEYLAISQAGMLEDPP